jgi:secretion-regulating guanine nucleotide exchange factor
VYGFGSARRGQVGKCVSRNQKTDNVPKLIDGFPNCKIVNIYANGDHSAAVDGKLCSSVVIDSHLLFSLGP